jgi:hypothetical protein
LLAGRPNGDTVAPNGGDRRRITGAVIHEAIAVIGGKTCGVIGDPSKRNSRDVPPRARDFRSAQIGVDWPVEV